MFSAVDWLQPWYRSVHIHGAEISKYSDWRFALNARSESFNIRTADRLPIRFVNPDGIVSNSGYESTIYQTGQVPTRDNLHDFFNALVWLSFPLIKQQLNALQAKQISIDGVQATRGGLRDAATLFDENALLLVARANTASNEMIEALRSHDWQRLFVANREVFHRCFDVWLFGHALMEKLMNPYKSIAAHAFVLRASHEYNQMDEPTRHLWIDSHVANRLAELNVNELYPGIFMPIPVLGIPDWWPGQDTEFYADQSVFRPKRLR